MARVLVIDVNHCDVHEAECDELEDFHRELNCKYFDITYRSIAGKYYDIFCDDIGLYAENPKVSAIDSDMQPVLVGNLILANHDRDGNTTSLTDDDIEWIKNNTIKVVTKNSIRPILFNCNY